MESTTMWKSLFLGFHTSLSDLKLGKLLTVYGCIDSISAAAVSGELNKDTGRHFLAMMDALGVNFVTNKYFEQALIWQKSPGHSIICYEEGLYPALLREIEDPPPLLYVIGDPKILSEPQIAVIGSRKATNYGRGNAKWLANELSLQGLTITSGLALGIDTQAHIGAIEGSGKTIAVAGTGVDRCYPKQNTGIREKIASSGALVSDYPLGMPPLAANFPRRNRIISGLSLGVLVVEAAQRSGSLITARMAMEQNRDVFALPGQINNPLAKGCHDLLRDGAKLVQSASDISEELSTPRPSWISAENSPVLNETTTESKQILSTDNEKLILEALKARPLSIDVLFTETGLEMNLLLSTLLGLESKNQLMLEQGRYSTYRQS